MYTTFQKVHEAAVHKISYALYQKYVGYHSDKSYIHNLHKHNFVISHYAEKLPYIFFSYLLLTTDWKTQGLILGRGKKISHWHTQINYEAYSAS